MVITSSYIMGISSGLVVPFSTLPNFTDFERPVVGCLSLSCETTSTTSMQIQIVFQHRPLLLALDTICILHTIIDLQPASQPLLVEYRYCNGSRAAALQ